jgi:hypothetical protein
MVDDSSGILEITCYGLKVSLLLSYNSIWTSAIQLTTSQLISPKSILILPFHLSEVSEVVLFNSVFNVHFVPVMRRIMAVFDSFEQFAQLPVTSGNYVIDVNFLTRKRTIVALFVMAARLVSIPRLQNPVIRVCMSPFPVLALCPAHLNFLPLTT